MYTHADHLWYIEGLRGENRKDDNFLPIYYL